MTNISATTTSTPVYKALFKTLKRRIQQARTRTALAISREILHVYWLTGRDIALRQEEEGWGKAVIKQLAQDLASEFPGVQGFSTSNLWRMRAFYLAYHENTIKLAQAVRETDDPPLPTATIRSCTTDA